MKYFLLIAKSLFIAFLTIILLSCYSNANGQNTAVSQAENSRDEAPLQAYTAPVSEQAETAETVHITNMTLIPSVEPELLRNVMPNSWRKLSRLTETEEQAFIRENTEVLLQIEEILKYYIMGWNYASRNNTDKLEYYCIYKQQVGVDVFYRVLVTFDRVPDFLSPAIRFTQYLIYEESPILFIGPYNSLMTTQRGYYVSFFSLDIISGAEKAKGIMVTELGFEGIGNPNWSKDAIKRNGQIYGSSSCEYYFTDDQINGNRSPMSIRASNRLVDPDVPLRYSLQNAFDGDPSTYYVANAEGELMNIDCNFMVSKIAVINGCAENITSYRNNNRIKLIVVGAHGELRNEELADDTLSWQVIGNTFGWFNTTEIYPGDIYNRTLIAGFNMYSDQYGWLFGDIHE
jgi:hypothetical protein